MIDETRSPREIFLINQICYYRDYYHQNNTLTNPKDLLSMIIVNVETDASEFAMESYFRTMFNHFKTINMKSSKILTLPSKSKIRASIGPLSATGQLNFAV
ncbi:hypothetical protein ACOME3_002975 [Neoechinorhynchus agilis]